MEGKGTWGEKRAHKGRGGRVRCGGQGKRKSNSERK